MESDTISDELLSENNFKTWVTCTSKGGAPKHENNG